MYPAIKHTTDYIAQEAYKVWSIGGDYEAVIAKLCNDHNVTDWVTTVLDTLTRIIRDAHLASRIG
jgi:hypothetical protein